MDSLSKPSDIQQLLNIIKVTLAIGINILFKKCKTINTNSETVKIYCTVYCVIFIISTVGVVSAFIFIRTYLDNLISRKGRTFKIMALIGKRLLEN